MFVSFVKNEKKLLNALGMLLTTVGLLSGFGAVTNIQPIVTFGQALAAAPLPRPFSNVNGYENFTSERNYEIVYQNGNREYARTLTKYDAALPGPHRRTIVYKQTLTWLPRLPHELTSAVIHYGLCVDNSIFSKLIHFSPGKIDYVLVRVTSKTKSRENDYWQFKYSCEK